MGGGSCTLTPEQFAEALSQLVADAKECRPAERRDRGRAEKTSSRDAAVYGGVRAILSGTAPSVHHIVDGRRTVQDETRKVDKRVQAIEQLVELLVCRIALNRGMCAAGHGCLP